MSANSKIEWTDHTFNGWLGCTKVSPACDSCYAEVSTPSRALGVTWGSGKQRRRTSEDNWKQPLRWNARHDKFFAEFGRRQRVFCSSLSDVFDNEVPIDWLVDILDLIRRTPNLDWLLLTKRIGNWKTRITQAANEAYLQAGQDREELYNWLSAWLDGNPPANVSIGATICNQDEADRDIIKLLLVPAAVHFLSMEPLLGPVNLVNYFDQGSLGVWKYGIEWVIVGGESGKDARPMHPDWVRSLRDQCASAGVPFFFKQWGEWGNDGRVPQMVPIWEKSYFLALDGKKYDGPSQSCPKRTAAMIRFGKKAAGRLLDGRTHDEFPKSILGEHA